MYRETWGLDLFRIKLKGLFFLHNFFYSTCSVSHQLFSVCVWVCVHVHVYVCVYMCWCGFGWVCLVTLPFFKQGVETGLMTSNKLKSAA